MFRKKTVTPNIQDTVNQSVNFEVTVFDIARKSERRAWMVAFSSIVLSLILIGGYFYLLPLKEKVPYMIMADAYTGTSSVAKLDEDFTNRSVTTSEAINRSNVAHFIMARESYDSALMGLRDWKTIHAMAAPNVSTDVNNLYGNTNPANPYKIYGAARAIRVKITNIVMVYPDGGVAGKTVPIGARVGIQRSIFDKVSGSTSYLDSKIVTMRFSYKPNLAMSDEARIMNPLSFQVSDYRTDSDYTTQPAVPSDSIQFNPAQPAATQQPGYVAPGSGPAPTYDQNGNPIVPAPAPGVPQVAPPAVPGAPGGAPIGPPVQPQQQVPQPQPAPAAAGQLSYSDYSINNNEHGVIIR